MTQTPTHLTLHGIFRQFCGLQALNSPSFDHPATLGQIGGVDATKSRGGRGPTHQAAVAAALLFVFLAPWENVIVIPGFGTAARAVGIALLGLYAIMAAARGSIRRPARFHFAMASFVLWGLATVAWSVEFSTSTLFAVTLIQLLVLVYLLYDLLDDEQVHGNALWALVLGGYVVSLFLIFNGLTGNVTQFERRASIPNSNENDVGIVLAMTMPIAWNIALDSANTRFRRLGAAMFVPVSYAAIIFTASRASLLATAPFILAILLSLLKSRPSHRFIYSVLVAGAAVVVARSAPESSLERLSTIGDSFSNGEFGSREIIWESGVEVLIDNGLNFVRGYGLGTFVDIVGFAAHQAFLAVAVETGLVGLLLFVGVLGVAVFHVRTLEPNARRMWITAMLVWLIGVQTLSWHLHTFTWLPLALAIADQRRARDDTEQILDLREPDHAAR